MKQEVTVFAPATVANVACGFDVMGFAIEGLGDEIVARQRERPGVHISRITGEGGRLPCDPDANTAGVAALALLKKLPPGVGIELEIHKKMPLCSGMGSSAASAVGAVVAINALLGEPFPRRALLPIAMEGEKLASGHAHADNIAPSLLGGIILIRSYDHPLDLISLPVPEKLICTLLHPAIEIRTGDTRDLLPEYLPLKDALKQVGNFGALVAGLLTEDYSLIQRALEDVIAEPRRAGLIPGFRQIKKAALAAGALGTSISGSGPAIFAFSTSRQTAVEIGAAMQQACQKEGVESTVYITPINRRGATVIASDGD